MNLRRLNHPGAGLTTAVVLLCGVVSGAAMAAGNRHVIDVPTSTQVAAVETPTLPGIPSVQTPRAQAVAKVSPPQSVRALQAEAKVPASAEATSASLDDALVLRPETPYTSKKAQAQPEPSAQVDAEATPAIASGKPFAGMNPSGLGIFMMLLLGGAGFLAYRKRQDEGAQDGDLTLEVASTIRIGAKWQVSLLRVPGRILVVGATERGLELLTELYPEGDAGGMDELLQDVQPLHAPAPQTQPVLSAPDRGNEDSPADAFDPLADISPRYGDTRSAGTYNRQPRRPATSPATLSAQVQPRKQSADAQGHDDAFLDAVLDRLSKARPAVIRHTTKPAPRVDERAALRAQVKQYRRGPTRL